MDSMKVVGKMISKKWYHIKARDMDIFQPNGKVITFWLFGENETEIMKMVIERGMIDVEWIAEEKPPFDN